MLDIKEHIKTAPEAEVRAVLQSLCAEDTGLSFKAEEIFSQLNGYKQSKRGTKRSAPTEVAFCIQCQEAFEPAENTDKSCRLHSGKYNQFVESGYTY